MTQKTPVIIGRADMIRTIIKPYLRVSVNQSFAYEFHDKISKIQLEKGIRTTELLLQGINKASN